MKKKKTQNKPQFEKKEGKLRIIADFEMCKENDTYPDFDPETEIRLKTIENVIFFDRTFIKKDSILVVEKSFGNELMRQSPNYILF